MTSGTGGPLNTGPHDLVILKNPGGTTFGKRTGGRKEEEDGQARGAGMKYTEKLPL